MQWAKTFPAIMLYCRAMAVPRENSIIMVGNSSNTVIYDDITFNSQGKYNVPLILLSGQELTSCDLKYDFTQLNSIQCADQTGSGRFTISGGDAPYALEWEDKVTFSKDTLRNLETNKYYGFKIQDIRSCILADSIKLDSPTPIELSLTITDSDSILATGTTDLHVTGGIPPYTHLWSNGSISQWSGKLAPGEYSVKVTDANDCEKIELFQINTLNGPKITLGGITNVSCSGGSDGAIGIDVTEGNPPYKFKWSNGSIKEDLNNIPAGIYKIQVEDSKGLNNSAYFAVNQPGPLDVIVTVRNPDCGNADGSAQVFIKGGITPYKYLWSNGDTMNYTDQLPVGIYSVRVTDKNGCKVIQKAFLSEIGAPEVSVNSINYPSCENSNGSIDISISGGSGKYNYSWSNSTFEQDLENVAAGEYYISVTDLEYSCINLSQFLIEDMPPDPPEICIVSVDSATGYIQVVIKESTDLSVQSYNVYQETDVLRQYNLLGSLSGGINIFVDSLSNSMQRPWKYRVSAVDECGNESGLSLPHKTIHLTMNIGLLNSINLIWNKYEGFPVGYYDIWRYRRLEGWSMIDRVPGDITSYTDFNSTPDDLLYYIEVLYPAGCEIFKTKADILNSTRSNRTARLKSYILGTGPSYEDDQAMLIYPNPNNGSFKLSFSSDSRMDVQLRIVNMNGSVIWMNKFSAVRGLNTIQINSERISPGIYSLILTDGVSCRIQRFIIMEEKAL